MRLAGLLLALAGCTRVERLSLPAGPPAAAELERSYAVAWSGGVLGVGTITAEVLGFEPYPCLGATESIGGSWTYDEASGAFAAELKTIDGGTKLVLAGTFSSGPHLVGTFEVLLGGLPCTAGVLTMDATP